GIARLRLADEVIKAAAADRMPGGLAGQPLPAPDDCVDIDGIELQPIATPTGALGRDHRRTTAEKAVEHDVAARRAVEHRIADQRHGFYSRMQGEKVAFLGFTGKRVDPGVMPDIAAVAAKLAKLDII